MCLIVFLPSLYHPLFLFTGFFFFFFFFFFFLGGGGGGGGEGGGYGVQEIISLSSPMKPVILCTH